MHWSERIKSFIQRFNYVEQKAKAMHQKLNDLSLEDMDKLWEEAKKNMNH